MMNREEREAFARVMLDDVISAVCDAGCRITLLCTHPFTHPRADTVVKDLGLNEALNECLANLQEPVLIIMSDLPLATPESIHRLISTDCDLAIVPGRGGGTNALFIRRPEDFHVDFYGASFLDHMAIAEEGGLKVEIVDSFRLHTDVDEKEDLVEIILHGRQNSRKFLTDRGFSLSIEKGRVAMQRDPHEEAF